MPLPSPSEGEDKDKFVERCMSNATMKKDFPDNKQRLAVCFSQFKKGKKESSEMETKSFNAPFELRSLDDATGIFEGHAAVFNVEDNFGDVILPGAFTKSLHKHPRRKIKMLHEHMKVPVGVWDTIKEDDFGLFVKGHLLLGLEAAQEVLILMKEEILDSLSIGFRTIKDQFDTDRSVRNLLEVKLFEISLVLFPAQDGALVTSLKANSPDEIRTKRQLESALCDAGFSIATSKYISAGWTPPGQRDVDGEQKLVEAMVSLTRTMKPA